MSVYEIMQIPGVIAFDKTPIKELLTEIQINQNFNEQYDLFSNQFYRISNIRTSNKNRQRCTVQQFKETAVCESMHGGVRGRGSNPPTYSIVCRA